MLFMISHASHSLTMLYNERPPYLKTESKQQVLGLTGTLITQAFKTANLPLHWKKTPAKRHLLLIKKNAEPLCAAGWFKNPQREKYAQYTLPIYQDRPTELITRKNNKKITASISLKQLFHKKHITLLVKNGYSYGSQIDQAIQQFKPKYIQTTHENSRMIKMLSKHIADYMFIAPEEATIAITSAGLLLKDFKLIKIIDILPGNKRYIICSQKVPLPLITKLNQAIKSNIP
ncbi:transporter substrate-binding domain-containing protein [Piscirickettsia salmonis]|uniref:transporter substrate-binding domain-containing protein n=1 Tax=Piscirickettsia salmonis TaxID=1238 RepID=UPI0012FED543